MIVFILLLFLSSLRLRIHAGLNVLKVTVASRKHPLLAVISLAMAAEKWTRAPSRGRPLEDTRVPRPLSFVSPENYSRCFERKGRKRRVRVLRPRKRDVEEREEVRENVVENAPSFLLPRWERSQVGRGPRATKFTTPFALRHPRHDSVMATRGGYPFGFSLICPAIKHAAESPLADTFYRRASLDVDRERERERLLYLCKGSPPSGNFMASGFSARLVRLSSSFVGRKEALYIQSWGLRRISCRPFKRCSRHNVNSFFDRVLSRWDPRIRCWWIVAPFNRCQRKCFEKWNPSPLAYSPSRWLIFNLWMEAFLARG